MLSNDMSSHTTDGSAVEEENNSFIPIPLIEKDDSTSLEYLDEVRHPFEENILPQVLSGSYQQDALDALQVKPRDQTDNILPRLSASSSSSSSSSVS